MNEEWDPIVLHDQASYIRPDNSGPPDTLSEIAGIVDRVKRVFPNAKVKASSFGAFASDVYVPNVLGSLPRTDLEWGDQWLMGMSTDSYRLAVYREMARARATCITRGACMATDPVMRNFTRFLSKASEHTQGVQNEQWSPGRTLTPDTAHWSNSEFQKVHNAKNNVFDMGDLSWIEASALSEAYFP